MRRRLIPAVSLLRRVAGDATVPSGMQRLLERTFEVEAAAERAWAALVAAEQWPRWARHLASVQVTPPGPVGGSARTPTRWPRSLVTSALAGRP